MNSIHTPAPWKWDGYALVPEARDPDQHAVHTIMGADTHAYGFLGADYEKVAREDDANRALIAAAPELLKAAELVWNDIGQRGEISPLTWEILASAIDKARGEA